MVYTTLGSDAVAARSGPWLKTQSSVSDDHLLVRVIGELDLAGRAAVETACASSTHPAVTVDLAALIFMDCAGYAGLVSARNAVIGRGGSFSWVNATGPPARLLGMIDRLERPGSTSMEQPT